MKFSEFIREAEGGWLEHLKIRLENWRYMAHRDDKMNIHIWTEAPKLNLLALHKEPEKLNTTEIPPTIIKVEFLKIFDRVGNVAWAGQAKLYVSHDAQTTEIEYYGKRKRITVPTYNAQPILEKIVNEDIAKFRKKNNLT